MANQQLYTCKLHSLVHTIYIANTDWTGLGWTPKNIKKKSSINHREQNQATCS